jgi:hypothetical protein
MLFYELGIWSLSYFYLSHVFGFYHVIIEPCIWSLSGITLDGFVQPWPFGWIFLSFYFGSHSIEIKIITTIYFLLDFNIIRPCLRIQQP